MLQAIKLQRSKTTLFRNIYSKQYTMQTQTMSQQRLKSFKTNAKSSFAPVRGARCARGKLQVVNFVNTNELKPDGGCALSSMLQRPGGVQGK